MRDLQVSVVIPTYNCARLLPEAIQSIRDQGWAQLEIIVVDDGSTDDTAAVLRALAGPDLRWLAQTNAGRSAARNRGITEAQGNWIAFQDADDLWLPGKLASQFAKLEEHPEARFVYGGKRLRHSDGREVDEPFALPSRGLAVELLSGNHLATPNVVAHRECFQQVGMFDESLTTGEDWDMWLRMALNFESCCVSAPLSIIRVSDDPAKYKLEELERCTLCVVDGIFRHYGECKSALAHINRRQVFAWHNSVLAKSYLRYGRWADFARLAIKAIGLHRSALSYLTTRGHGPPCFG